MVVNTFYKQIFNFKTYKLSLNAGCTCPTRDGTRGQRGCIFCSAEGSGDFTPDNCIPISEQVDAAKRLVASKLKNQQVKYIVYFQSFTNTYGNFQLLKKKWEEALNCEDVVGISIGTRPDCLYDECVEYLGCLAEKTFVQVELGFQTSNEKSAEYIRRGFVNQVYYDAVKKLHDASKKIHVVTHVIFGLPEEELEDMMNTIRSVIDAKSDGIKITCLYVLKETDLEKDYFAGKFNVLSEDEYFSLLEEALKYIPQNVVIHRLTGDPPKSILIEPKWTMNKKKIVNRVNNLLTSFC